MNHLSIAGAIEYREKQRTKQRIILTENMTSELLCYEPGQGTVEHHHINDDEAFFVIEGEGTITVDDESFEVGTHDLVFAPKGARHGLQADKGSRLSVIYFRAPGRNASKTGMVYEPGDRS